MCPGARRIAAVSIIVLLMASIVSTSYPAHAADAGQELKQIEYRYYFRGRYQQAIEALQTFLARVDLTPAQAMRAREVLAASFVLGGAPAMGKETFGQLIAADPSYPGPDPSVFKLEVLNVYAEARADYAARNLTTVPGPDPAAAAADEGAPAGAAAPDKPIYKKWWFYAGTAVALLAVGAAVAGGDDGAPPSAETGTVGVGVRVQ